MANQHFLDKPRNVKRVLRTFYVVCAGLLAADLIFTRHVLHSWDALFGFYAVFGWVACVALVLTAKEMRKLLMRKEDYYDR